MGSVGNTQNTQTKATQPAISPSQVEVDNTYYTALNGSTRGKGTWFFFPDKAREDFTNAITVNGTYSAAKKEAQQEAARRGFKRLYVGT